MTVRPARESDVERISDIISGYASEGLMLPRSRSGLLAALEHYLVADLDGLIVGCGGLQPYSSTSAEVYALATALESSPKGTGSAILRSLIEKANGLGLSRIFALTLAPGFFEKMGFRRVLHEELPEKVWKDCVACPKFGNCNEIAMVLDL